MNRRCFIKTVLLWLTTSLAIIAATPQQLLLLSKPPAAPVASSIQSLSVDMYVDFEALSIGDSITVAGLNAATHGGAGSWSLTPDPVTNLKLSVQEYPGTNITAGGSVYTDVGSTRALIKDGNDSTDEYCTYTLTTAKANVSLGFFFKADFVKESGYWDVARISSAGGVFCVLSFHNNLANGGSLAAHTAGGTGTYYSIDSRKLYYISMKFASGDNGYVNIYQASDGTLVGASSAVLAADNANQITLGLFDYHSEAQNSQLYYDDLIVDYTTATFPLGPIKSTGYNPADPGWRPTDVAGLKLWLRADAGTYSDAGTTPANLNDTVYQWNDQSGNGINAVQSTSGARMLLTTNHWGSRVLQKNGANNCWYPVNSLSVAAGSKTFFFVGRTTSDSSGQDLIDSETGRLVIYTMDGSTHGPAWYDGSTRNFSTNWFDPSFHTIIWVLPASGTGNVYVDGTVCASGASYNSTAIGGSTALFSRYDGSSGYLLGDIAEMGVWDSAIDATARSNLQAYLKWKYNTR